MWQPYLKNHLITTSLHCPWAVYYYKNTHFQKYLILISMDTTEKNRTYSMRWVIRLFSDIVICRFFRNMKKLKTKQYQIHIVSTLSVNFVKKYAKLTLHINWSLVVYLVLRCLKRCTEINLEINCSNLRVLIYYYCE